VGFAGAAGRVEQCVEAIYRGVVKEEALSSKQIVVAFVLRAVKFCAHGA
jgi:hypothetical protein